MIPKSCEPAFANFAANLRRLRRQRGLSKQSMARLLGIGTATLTRLENGILPPRLGVEILFVIHEEFGLLPSQMFAESGEDNS